MRALAYSFGAEAVPRDLSHIVNACLLGRPPFQFLAKDQCKPQEKIAMIVEKIASHFERLEFEPQIFLRVD